MALMLSQPNLPDGLLPYAVLLCVFMLANFSVVAVRRAAHAAPKALMSPLIIVTNMAVTLFMFLVGAHARPCSDHLRGRAPVWNSAVWTVLAVELATLVTDAFILPYFVAARRRDFI